MLKPHLLLASRNATKHAEEETFPCISLPCFIELFTKSTNNNAQILIYVTQSP
jgi:hypothetical protein